MSTHHEADRLVSAMQLAVIGRNHFGNPIPREWYAAARELLSTPPSAPQAAGADERDGQRPGYPETSRDWLAALVDIWDDMQNNAPEDRAYVPEALSESIDKARAHLSITLPQVREQAALPPAGYSALIESAAEVLTLRTNGDKLTAAASLALDERLCLIAIKMRSAADAIAQGTTPAAGVGEQAQAEPMSDGWISVEDRLPEPGTECFVWVIASPFAKPGVHYAAIDNWDEQREDPLGMGGPTIATGVMWGDHEFEDVSHWMPINPPHAILAEAGIKEKTNG